MTKRRILVWADSPTVATGFAQVSRNILKELHKTGKYEIDMVGINFHGEYDRQTFEKEYGFIDRIVPAQQMTNPDMYGREFLVKTLAGFNQMLQPPYDIFFSIQDHFIIQQKDSMGAKGLGQAIKAMQKNTLANKEVRENHFLWIGYYPVDGRLKKEWVDEAIGTCDYPVAYCEYGRDEMLKFESKENNLKSRVKVIYHGTNTDDFFPATPEEKKLWRSQIFKGADPDAFILMNVARNQPRKDLFKTLQVFKELLKEKPNALLYMHCDPTDPAGGNLFDMAKAIDLPLGKLLFARAFTSTKGVSLETLNKIYNSADAFITTTLGEGWGLPITEAMACKLPVYAPNITAITDILDTHEGFNPQVSRGMAFKAGSTPTEWVNFGKQDNETPRPLSNVESAVSMLRWGFENPEKLAEIVERAYQWAITHTWAHEVEKWVEIFEEACTVNDQLRSPDSVPVEKIGRNDTCPVCGDKKIKNCPQHRDIYLK